MVRHGECSLSIEKNVRLDAHQARRPIVLGRPILVDFVPVS